MGEWAECRIRVVRLSVRFRLRTLVRPSVRLLVRPSVRLLVRVESCGEFARNLRVLQISSPQVNNFSCSCGRLMPHTSPHKLPHSARSNRDNRGSRLIREIRITRVPRNTLSYLLLSLGFIYEFLVTNKPF